MLVKIVALWAHLEEKRVWASIIIIIIIVQEPPKQQQPATVNFSIDDTRDNVGLRPDNEYRRRLRSASRNVSHTTDYWLSASEMQVVDSQLSAIAQLHADTARQLQQTVDSGFQRLQDGIGARTSTSTSSSGRRVKFRSHHDEQRRLFNEDFLWKKWWKWVSAEGL